MFHSNQQEAQGATGCGKDKQHYEGNSIMTKRLDLYKKKKKKKKKDEMTAKDNWAGLDKKTRKKLGVWEIGRDMLFPEGPKTAKKGGMIRGYATGGSVSRGQYPSQARKVKFKGVF